MLPTLYFVLAAIVILIGMAGTIVPAMPGVPLVFAGMWLAAWADHYHHVGKWTLILLFMLAALAVLVDFVAGLLGAKRVGASALALWGAAFGTIIGMFFGLPGLLFGPFAGALVGELIHGSQVRRATSVGIGTWLGLLFGTLAKIGVCFTMLGVFVLAFLL